jgi:hypothetical protein
MKKVVESFSGSKPKIFISYRRSDTIVYAGRLRADLAQRFGAEQVFMDFDNIRPGEEFKEVIERAVRSCDILIAIIGNHWFGGTDGNISRLDDPKDYVRQEIVAALDRRIPVIPILVQNAPLPKTEHLPKQLEPLLRHQALDIGDQRWDYDVGLLIKSIESYSPTKSLRRVVTISSAILLIALMILGVAWNYRGRTAAVITNQNATPSPQQTAGTELLFSPANDIQSLFDVEKGHVKFSLPLVVNNTSDQEIVIMEIKSELKPLITYTDPLHLIGFESTLLNQDANPLKAPIKLTKGKNILSYSVVFELNETLRNQLTSDYMQELTVKFISSDKKRFSFKICFTVGGLSEELKEKTHSNECPEE